MTVPTRGSESVASTRIVSLARFASVGGGARGLGGGGLDFGLGQRRRLLLGLDGGDDGALRVEESAGDALHVVGGDGEDGGRVAAIFVPAQAVTLVESERGGERGAALQRDLVRADEI